MNLFTGLFGRDQRLEILKEKLVKVDKRAQNFPLVWGESNHARDKKTITLAKGEVHNEDTFTFIAIHLLSHCLNPVYGHGPAHQKIVKELVRRARYASVLNLDNVTCDTSFFRENMMSS